MRDPQSNADPAIRMPLIRNGVCERPSDGADDAMGVLHVPVESKVAMPSCGKQSCVV